MEDGFFYCLCLVHSFFRFRSYFLFEQLMLIYQATDNQRLVQLISNLREQMYRYRIEYLKDVEIRDSLVEEHYAICEALKRRDAQGAYQHTFVHISRQQDRIMKMMKQ